MSVAMLVLIGLIGTHVFLDFAGQGDFMAKAKNPVTAFAGVPSALVLWLHATLHGAAVALITGLWPLFILETVVHANVDDQKNRGNLSFAEDQGIHLGCKVVWWLLWILVS